MRQISLAEIHGAVIGKTLPCSYVTNTGDRHQSPFPEREREREREREERREREREREERRGEERRERERERERGREGGREGGMERETDSSRQTN